MFVNISNNFVKIVYLIYYELISWQDEIVARIEERIATWTFLPKGLAFFLLTPFSCFFLLTPKHI